MKIKMKTGLAGNDFSYSPDEVVDTSDGVIDEETAQRLIDSGAAELVKSQPKKKAVIKK